MYSRPGIFSRRTKRTQEAQVYSHGGPSRYSPLTVLFARLTRQWKTATQTSPATATPRPPPGLAARPAASTPKSSSPTIPSAPGPPSSKRSGGTSARRDEPSWSNDGTGTVTRIYTRTHVIRALVDQGVRAAGAIVVQRRHRTCTVIHAHTHTHTHTHTHIDTQPARKASPNSDGLTRLHGEAVDHNVDGLLRGEGVAPESVGEVLSVPLLRGGGVHLMGWLGGRHPRLRATSGVKSRARLVGGYKAGPEGVQRGSRGGPEGVQRGVCREGLHLSSIWRGWYGQVKTPKRASAPTTDCKSGCTVRKGEYAGLGSLHRLPATAMVGNPRS
eukprot:1191690-Prorocentrum_minimum.AAC.1